jgi:NAD(P)-dependent dehydrogenase (short-subunit alcohol dehydrogenase family)
VTFMALDLSSLESVKAFAAHYKEKGYPLHVLINNAGVMALPRFSTSKDGYEMQWATNHLGHFLLTLLLHPVLKSSAPSRVVNVSSMAHKQSPSFSTAMIPPPESSYGPWSNYGFSKLSNILFAAEAERRWGSEGIHSFSLHPGVIPTGLLFSCLRSSHLTELSRHMWVGSLFVTLGKVFMKSIPQVLSDFSLSDLSGRRHDGLLRSQGP